MICGTTARTMCYADHALFKRLLSVPIQTLKRKCVRGVVPVEKLLAANPWSQFTWIEGSNRPIRQFDSIELLSLLEHFKSHWGGVPVAVLAAKVFLWSACRKSEVAGLTWSSLRLVG